MLAQELKLTIKKENETEGTLVIGPLQRGMGHTIGNSLRRVMLSFLAGAAVTEMRIEGVAHEFSTIKGVKEDVIEILLQVKKINFKMTVNKPLIVTLDVKGPATVTAGDLHCPSGIEVLNKDLVLAHLTDKKARLKMELKVELGRGYRIVEQEKARVGTILVDADFGPVRQVSYRVQPTRVGRQTGLDQVEMEIKTDGSLSPSEALREAATVLYEHFSFLQSGAVVRRTWEEEQGRPAAEVKRNLPEMPVYLEEFNLPTRLLNALKEAGIQTLEDLQNTPAEKLNKVRNIGPKSLELLQQILEKKKDDAQA